MKKALKETKTKIKAKDTIYFRYEFSDETGRPEGGDIFQFSSLTKLQKMMSEVLVVAQSDGVTVNLTVGNDDHFFKYLKNTGMSQKEIAEEMVESSLPLASKAKPAKKKTRNALK